MARDQVRVAQYERCDVANRSSPHVVDDINGSKGYREKSATQHSGYAKSGLFRKAEPSV